MTRNIDLPAICQTELQAVMSPDFFKALCDPMRISIVATLATMSAPARVSDIAECCGIDFSGVSRHLKILREAGILNAEKEGRAVLYSLKTEELAETLRAMASALEACQKQAI